MKRVRGNTSRKIPGYCEAKGWQSCWVVNNLEFFTTVYLAAGQRQAAC